MKTKSTSSPYHRMLLFCDLSSETGKTFYLVENRKCNISLFLMDTSIRDDGVITTGSYFSIQNPSRVTNYMDGGILLINTTNSLVCLKTSVTREF